MVVFNPDLPNPNDTTPKWGRDSQPTTRWEGNKSSEVALKGFGDVLETGVKGVDFLIKDKISTEAWEKVNAEREAYSNALEASVNTVSPQKTTDRKVLDDVQAQPPAGIDRTLKYLENIKAGADAGKVNDTYYKSRLVAIAKDLRSSYPGYREYIDQKISGITGFDPANSKITDLLADMNALVKTGKDKEDADRNRVLSVVDNYVSQVDGASTLYTKILNKEITPAEGMTKLGEITKPLVEANITKRDFETAKTRTDKDQFLAENHARKFSAASKGGYISSIQDTISMDQVREFQAKIRAGNVDKATQEQIVAVGWAVEQKAENYKRILRAELTKPNQHGISIASIKGNKWVEDFIRDEAAEFQQYADALKGKDATMATYVADNIKHKSTDAGARLFNDDKLGPHIQTLAGNKAALGETITSRLLEQSMIPTLLPEMQTYMQRTTMAAANQEIVPNPKGPITFKHTVEQAEKNNITPPSTADAALRFLQNIVDPSVDDRAKQGYVRYFFDTANLGAISKFDGEQKGLVFKSITSPGVIQEAYRVTADKPELRAMIVNWTKQSFGKEFLSTELKDLNAWKLVDGSSILFDDKTNKWRLFFKGQDITDNDRFDAVGTIGKDPNASSIYQVRTGLNRINSAWDNVINVAKRESANPAAWIYQMMLDEGYNPLSATAPVSIPEHMIRSIANPRLREQMLQGKD